MITLSLCSPTAPVCGKIFTLSRRVSGLISQSSPVHDMPVILAQLPILFFHPMILPRIKLKGYILVSARIVESEIRTPAPILQLAPMTTLGPS